MPLRRADIRRGSDVGLGRRSAGAAPGSRDRGGSLRLRSALCAGEPAEHGRDRQRRLHPRTRRCGGHRHGRHLSRRPPASRRRRGPDRPSGALRGEHAFSSRSRSRERGLRARRRDLRRAREPGRGAAQPPGAISRRHEGAGRRGGVRRHGNRPSDDDLSADGSSSISATAGSSWRPGRRRTRTRT